MQKFEYTVKNEIGLHARPAGLLVKEARKFQSRITLSAGGKSAGATQLMALMGMAIKGGMTVSVQIEGADEADCAAAIRTFFENNL